MKIVANLNTLVLNASGNQISFQAISQDILGNYRTVNLNASVGITSILTNASIGAAIVTDFNSNFGTSYLSTDLILFGVATYL